MLFSECSSAKGVYFRGPYQASRYVLRTHGVRGMYHGFSSMAYRDVPTFGVYTLTYEVLFDQMVVQGLSDTNGIFASLMAGGCAGVACWTLAIPWDNVKSLLQADTGQSRFSGDWQCVKYIYTHKGIKGFFTGLPVCCLRAFPVNAVTFLFYSQCLKLLNSYQAAE